MKHWLLYNVVPFESIFTPRNVKKCKGIFCFFFSFDIKGEGFAYETIQRTILLKVSRHNVLSVRRQSSKFEAFIVCLMINEEERNGRIFI